MKNFKKVLAMALSATMLLGALAGCGRAETETAQSQGSASSSGATESTYPAKQINLIIQASPGGLSDTNARAIAQIVEKDLGVPVVCSNKPGAAGAVAMSFLQASKPDGYTIGYVPVELSMVKALGYATDIYPDAFDLICGCNIQPAAITVRADSGWETIDDLVNWCKEHPGELKVGTSGTGGLWEIAGEVFAKEAGIEVNMVPFDGAAPAVTAIMGSHVQMVPVSESEVASGVASGELKILAVCSAERTEFNPEVPTLKELGYDVDVSAWGGFALPKGTPDDVKEVLYESFEKAVDSDTFRELAATKQYSPMVKDHDEFSDFANAQYDFYEDYFAQN